MSSELSEEQSMNQLLEKREEIDQLTRHIEERVKERTEERTYFSTDVVSLGEHKVKVDVYGVEGYPAPDQRTVAEAVGEFYDWTAGFEEGKSTDDMYSIHVVDWDSI